MALYAISDLHLSLGTDKPMDIFSSLWEDHAEKLRQNWTQTVTEEDTVVIPGDISWATYLEDAKMDFSFLDSLPGRKIISKGNHDYWWTTATKLKKFIEANNFRNISFLHNSYYTYEQWAICGTRGWSSGEGDTAEENKKIFARERQRLELSLQQGTASGKTKVIAVLHYPPFNSDDDGYGFIDILKKYKVSICLYGHLHGDFDLARQGMIEGIDFRLVSSDYLNFSPLKIL